MVPRPVAARRRGPPCLGAGLQRRRAPAGLPGRRDGHEERHRSGGARESSAKVTSYCTDEGCFDCGDGFCMQGWYCDLGVRGGPACSFVPECEAQSSCACVTAVLGGGCRCDERDGGAYVTCD